MAVVITTTLPRRRSPGFQFASTVIAASAAIGETICKELLPEIAEVIKGIHLCLSATHEEAEEILDVTLHLSSVVDEDPVEGTDELDLPIRQWKKLVTFQLHPVADKPFKVEFYEAVVKALIEQAEAFEQEHGHDDMTAQMLRANACLAEFKTKT